MNTPEITASELRAVVRAFMRGAPLAWQEKGYVRAWHAIVSHRRHRELRDLQNQAKTARRQAAIRNGSGGPTLNHSLAASAVAVSR